MHDMLGLYEDFVPIHTKQFATLGRTIRDAVSQYVQEVESGQFPTSDHSFSMDEALLQSLYGPPPQEHESTL
jgi:3-methyl-2-oxobutanoate hydroxymethyltransferase